MSDALKNAEDWHKANQSKGSIDLVKRLISEDTTVNKNGTQTPLLITLDDVDEEKAQSADGIVALIEEVKVYIEKKATGGQGCGCHSGGCGCPD